MRVMEFARMHSSERTVALGVLGLRGVRYIGEVADNDKMLVGPPVSGLTVWARGWDERPTYHPDSGYYGFLRLPRGPQRIHIVDPLRRYLPRAIEIDEVPDRRDVKAALERGVEPAEGLPGVLYQDVPLRPGIGYPLPPGETAVWGQVLQSNRKQPVPYARLSIETRFLRRDGTSDAPAVPREGTVTTYSDLDGMYLARLPHERPLIPPQQEGDGDDEVGPIETQPSDDDADEPGSDEADLIRKLERQLSVHCLNEQALRELTRFVAVDPLLAFPARFEEAHPGGPYLPADFSLRDESGRERLSENDHRPSLEILVGRRVRWDIVLT